MKNIYLFFLFISIACFGQLTPPTELQAYYSGIDFNLTGNDLYDDLATLTVNKHTTILTYSQRHDYLYDADEDLNDASRVILIYSGDSRYELEYESGNNLYMPQTFNTEHVYLRSLLDDPNAEADLHNLRVCDIAVNSSRDNDPFIDGSGAFGPIGSSWYPGDEWKGDVARIIFYLNLRYNEPFSDVGTLSLFLDWNAEDPVSFLEDQRNSVISGVQGDRNPFIDNPYLATLIWGGTAAENRWNSLNVNEHKEITISMYPNPVNEDFVYFTMTEGLDVILYNILGKSVLKKHLDSNHKKIDTRSLPQGMYLVRLVSEHGSTTKKLIKN